jgi:hypothetical protein
MTDPQTTIGIKYAVWTAAPRGVVYHWCPVCEKLHPIPTEGWTKTGSEGVPTFTPSFGQHDRKGYCHYNITNGNIVFHLDSYHKRSDTVEMPFIPIRLLERDKALIGLKTEAVFEQ